MQDKQTPGFFFFFFIPLAGRITAKRSIAKDMEEAVWQSQPLDWQCRGSEARTSVELVALGGRGDFSVLAFEIPCAAPPAEFVLGRCSLKASQMLWGARLEAGSSSTIVI